MSAQFGKANIRLGGLVLLLALAACTAVDRGGLGSPPGMAPVGKQSARPALPVNPQIGKRYTLKGDAEHPDNGNHYGKLKPNGPRIDESKIVVSEELFTLPVPSGTPQPVDSLVAETVSYVSTAYGPVTPGSAEYIVMSMQAVREADEAARKIAVVSGDAKVLVTDVTGQFQPSAVPEGVAPDTYAYARVFSDAVTGEVYSVLLSKTPFLADITPPPTPMPTPTPTPTPTPVPAGLDVRPNINRLVGFKVAPNGDIFIFGDDPIGLVDASPNQGRILKVPSNLSGVSVLTNSVGLMAEAEFDSSGYLATVMVPNAGAIKYVKIDPNSGAVVSSTSVNQFGLLPYLANTIDESGHWFSGGGGTSQNLFDFGLSTSTQSTPVYFFPLTSAPAEWYRPISMSWDTTANRAVWACEYGIVALAPGATSNDLPEPIVRVQPGIAYGMEQVTPAGGAYLYSSWGILPSTNPDWQSVFYAEAGGTPTVALRLNNAAPNRIERDSHGNFYVMATEGYPGSIVYRAASTSGKPNVRIIKCRFDAVTKKLIPERTLIDTFNNKEVATY